MYLYDNGYKTVFGILVESNIDELLNEKLKELCYERLNNHHKIERKSINKYFKRLNEELKIVFEKGTSKYFIESYKLITELRKENYIVGPDTLFASSSLINYLLGITEIDPIQYDLLFECFYNSELGYYPRIYLSIQKSKSDEVFNYLTNKYNNCEIKNNYYIDEYKNDVCLLAFIENVSNNIKNDLMIYDSINLNDNEIENILLQKMMAIQIKSGKNYIYKIDDFNLNDAINLSALFRPGLAYSIRDYVKIRNDGHSICSPKIFEPFLKSTYGIVLFHEQIIKMISFVTGYSYAKADAVRKALLSND